MSKHKVLTVEFFVATKEGGRRPLKNLSKEELEAWSERTSQRLNRSMSRYYSVHTEEFEQLYEKSRRKEIEYASCIS